MRPFLLAKQAEIIEPRPSPGSPKIQRPTCIRTSNIQRAAHLPGGP